MKIRRSLLALLLTLVGWSVAAHAQTATQDWKRWTVRYFNAFDAPSDSNAGGFANYLDARGFGDSSQNFLGGGFTDYPLTSDGGGGGWSVLAAYAYRPHLSFGGSFHRGASIAARGFRNAGFERPRLGHELWGVAPIALWTPASAVAVGAGPAFIQGTITFSDGEISNDPSGGQEQSVMRLGAVAFASLGFTLLSETLYFGVQGQYLYVGNEEVGPYDLRGETIEAGSVRLDQFTFGPLIAVNL